MRKKKIEPVNVGELCMQMLSSPMPLTDDTRDALPKHHRFVLF